MRRPHAYILASICALVVIAGGFLAWTTYSPRFSQNASRHLALSEEDLATLCKLVEGGDVNGVRSLLDRGADPRYRYRYSWVSGDCLGETELPLIALAAREGHSNLVELLGEYGANPEDLCSDEPGGRGTTALGLAAFSGEKESVVSLIGLGADVEPKVEWSARPLFLALFGQVHAEDRSRPSVYSEIADILVAHGASATMVDEDGCTLLHGQTTQYSRASMEWVLAHGVDLNARDKPRNYTPLYMAIANRLDDAVSFFLERGADTTIRDWRGRDAMDLAQVCKASTIEELLRSHAEKKKSAEQDSAGQPATRSESNPEGGDKPQPESEGRSR
jgi:ankyrin repeat protein